MVLKPFQKSKSKILLELSGVKENPSTFQSVTTAFPNVQSADHRHWCANFLENAPQKTVRVQNEYYFNPIFNVTVGYQFEYFWCIKC